MSTILASLRLKAHKETETQTFCVYMCVMVRIGKHIAEYFAFLASQIPLIKYVDIKANRINKAK